MNERAPAPVAPQRILRDHLAMERTTLANERTLLAYIRTALALLITGASALHIPGLRDEMAFGFVSYEVLGWIFIAFGVILVVIGYWRYMQIRRRIAEMPEEAPP